ncbi:MAG: oxygen-independent coproporphyrinogen III oxidase [Dysgonamonadaceae bacterium]|jgi:oxygen-independent coproporphyrinogen-3 oxidase|nr:oxygen-independent coproporphyrinogen III oxidase [Dysgonamonadaceae bacterium]
MIQHLHRKYDRFIPRYTSYPPANRFRPNFTEKEYLKEITVSNGENPSHLSFYFHIPFCPTMCHYCGCNSVKLHDENELIAYRNALSQELDVALPLLSTERKVSQIHFGGGTPSTLSFSSIRLLMQAIFDRFDGIDSPEIAIECHPGYVNESFLEELKNARFNRISLGIQDFDPAVLKCVNRVPPRIPLETIIHFIHSEMNASVNLDFIYGLPRQTPSSFLQNMEQAVLLRPDRIVLFPYAHLPQLFKRQQILEKAGLPSPESKLEMFEKAVKFLETEGYRQVGMDHFVLPDDELYQAAITKQLHRNFQGYCSKRTTGQVYAFGVSGISQLSGCYAQNTKNFSLYLSSLASGHLPVERGYVLSPSERITREIISSLMCNYAVEWAKICESTGKSSCFDSPNFRCNRNRLNTLCEDGIIELNDNGIEVTEVGKPFVRHVATCFDPFYNDIKYD